jgi:hypothetical protein
MLRCCRLEAEDPKVFQREEGGFHHCQVDHVVIKLSQASKNPG